MHPNPPDPNSCRDLLIALNAVLPGNRDFACKLSANPGAWLGLHSAAVAGTAARLSVPVRVLREAIALLPKAHEIARTEVEGCERLGARVITRFDDTYPASLFDLPHPPPVLYYRGELDDRPAIAVVGSRRSDAYGLEVSRLFSGELGGHGLTIVSGMALGIDAAAHQGALEAGARTIAVLGCGIDIDYPYRHRHLARKIAESGAVISEFPLGSEPRGWRFPVRNRIIAALASGTLIVRATPRSGSLITARHALDLGRDVYSVPGDIFDQRSVGTNSLIRDGALPVQHPKEILETLPLAVQARLEPPAKTKKEGSESSPAPLSADLDGRLAALLSALPASREMSEEEAVTASDLPLDEALASLLELELLGLVERRPGPRFVRRGRRLEESSPS